MSERQQLVGLVTVSIAITLAVAIAPGLLNVAINDASGLGDWVAGSTSVLIQAVIIFYLIKTYSSQKKELEEQRNLLKLGHDEAQRKRFEEGFYQLLARYDSVVQGLVYPGSSTYSARRIFPRAASECMGYVRSEGYNKEVKNFFDERDWWLGDWIRAVFMIVKYIRESDRTIDEQRIYLKIFRGYASAPEARLLLVYLTTRLKGRSDTAIYLLQNQFFKYSYVSTEKNFDQLNTIMIDLHGHPIYKESTIPTPGID